MPDDRIITRQQALQILDISPDDELLDRKEVVTSIFQLCTFLFVWAHCEPL